MISASLALLTFGERLPVLRYSLKFLEELFVAVVRPDTSPPLLRELSPPLLPVDAVDAEFLLKDQLEPPDPMERMVLMESLEHLETMDLMDLPLLLLPLTTGASAALQDLLDLLEM